MIKKTFADDSAWNLPREQLKKLQWKRLKKQINYVFEKSPLYRRKFDEIGVTPKDIKSIQDFRELPMFMTKTIDRDTQELTRTKYGHPFGEYLCIDPSEVRAIHSTSGTTGLPVFEAFSEHDIAVESEVIARTIYRSGIKPGDYVLHVTGLSMWLAGMVPMRAYQYMGVAGIPVGAESGAERVLQFAKLIKAKGMFCIPSFAEYLLRKAPEVAGIDARELGIKVIMAAGEPGAGIPETRKRLTEGFNAKVFDNTGGIWGFGAVSCDSPEYQGMHLVCEDYHYLDIVDPETKKPIDMSQGGGVGEMVHTALEWEAQPAFRYAYGDIIELTTEPCPCGIPGMRMRYKGRVDDLVIVKGVNIFPAAVKGVIDSFIPKVTGEMRIVLTTPPPRVVPPLRMKVEYGTGVAANELEQLKEQLENAVSNKLRTRPAIELVPPNSLPKDPAKKAKLIEKNY